MKLSFSIPKSASNSKHDPIRSNSSKDHTNPPKHLTSEFDPSEPPTANSSKDQTNPRKDLITEFDSSKTPTYSEAKIVIPPIQNQWRPKMKNLELPITDPNSDAHSLQFESETLSASATEPASDIAYGLTLRKQTINKNNNDNNGDDDRARYRAAPVENVLLQKFKDDLKSLPDDQGFEEFKDVPVEGFGAALLSGYGWSEGMGIGRNAKEDVKIVQYDRRAGKEGLGFVSNDLSSSRKKKEGSDGRGTKENGRRTKENGRDRDAEDVSELDSAEGERRHSRKSKESRSQRDGSEKDSRKKHGRGRDEFEERRVEVDEDSRKEKRAKRQVSWLTSHIRVRVVSKDLKRGRLYLKKGKVLDVVGPTTCDISMDESKEIVQGVSQEFLETAIPRCGGPVLVLFGKHKGAYGSLVERDLDREIGVVRDADTHDLLSVKLEQIAEYLGDPSLLGY
ncbi:hypothetical protein RIF29_38950 [Crotalaria pallida]|uniref:G-patch domain-containing protein n=1 Tax=Crotalaria pallida TaxID=3830 RepID=A0AAN9E6I5_CROPI